MTPEEFASARVAAGAAYVAAAAALRAAWVELRAHDIVAANVAAQSPAMPAGFPLPPGLESLVHADFLPRAAVEATGDWAGAAVPRASELRQSLAS